jgi:hypothetical protein
MFLRFMQILCNDSGGVEAQPEDADTNKKGHPKVPFSGLLICKVEAPQQGVLLFDKRLFAFVLDGR